jgi:hypothetical protein
LGLTSLDVYTTILGLSVSDYCEGPAKDYAEKGDCWVFGTVINGCEIYIKLKIAAISIIKKVRIISFHIADKALCYPCRQTEGDKEGQKNGEENN